MTLTLLSLKINNHILFKNINVFIYNNVKENICNIAFIK